MVDRRGVERFFARVWSQAKRDFGFVRQPDSLDRLNERLRLRGYGPVIRCIVVGLGLAASYVIFYIFFGTIEGQNLANLLLLGGVLHKLVNRPRGAEVHWPSFLRAAAVPALFLVLPRLSSLADDVRKEREELEEWRRQTFAT